MSLAMVDLRDKYSGKYSAQINTKDSGKEGE
jgi:hypothetical protein